MRFKDVYPLLVARRHCEAVVPDELKTTTLTWIAAVPWMTLGVMWVRRLLVKPDDEDTAQPIAYHLDRRLIQIRQTL